ncbi:hypothetical protein HS7_20620 [Sulfolobales archaeon HS-7]|nr:hypothetical protein HS7_20620 [Sulfolobales archaeon HS-7]
MYELLLRTDIDYKKLKITDIFTHSFKIYYYNDGEYTHIYLDSNADQRILQQYFAVKPSDFNPYNFKYWTEIIPDIENDFYYKLHYNSLDNFISSSLQKEQILCILASIDNKINREFLRRSHKLKDRQTRDAQVQRQQLESFAKDTLYSIRLVLLSNELGSLLDTAYKLASYVVTNSNNIGVKTLFGKPLRTVYPNSWKAFLSLEDYEYDNDFAQIRRLDYKKRLWATQDDLQYLVTFPTTVKIPLGLSVTLPYYKLERKPEICIGKDLVYGEEVCLEPIDFIGHAFFFGASRSGKSNTLEVIAKQLKNYGVVIFIDPNSQSARKLSQIADMYFSITKEKPNFGLNILQLPHIFEDRKKNIDYQIANVLELFDKLLQLPENAPNVRYILQVLLYQMYKLTDNVTFQDVYNAVIDLYNGNLDLDVNDEQFQKEVEMLQKMQPQSFFSILTRIKMLVENDTFKYITSETTLDWEKLIPKLKKGLIAFDVGKSSGEIVSQTVQMMIALSLFYYVFRRDQRGEDKIPIYFVVDEAQNIAHFSFLGDILAEAAKYALHLILATQSYVRLMDMAGEGNARGLMANTNVKLVMRIVEGNDANEIAKSAGLKEFVDVFPKLSRGMGFLTIGGKPGELSAIKFIQVNYSGLEDKEGKLTEGFEPKIIGSQDIAKMLNPILQLIEKKPEPLELVILYRTFRNGKKIYMPDLLRELGVDRDRVEDAINKLAAAGMIDVTKEGNKKAIIYVKGLFPLKHVVENEEGKKVALRVIKKYYDKGYIVIPGRQQGDIRADFLALKYDSSYKLKYDDVIAAEIESPNELSVHAEQVVRNMKKYNELPNAAKDRIAEIHIWTSEEAYPKLEKAYKKFLEDNTIDESYKNKVKIFSIKIKEKAEPKVQQPQQKIRKPNTSTGEFTQAKQVERQEVRSESKVVTNAPSAATGNNNNEEGEVSEGPEQEWEILEPKSALTPQLITLAQLELQVIDMSNGKAIIKVSDKEYRINIKDLEDLQGLRDMITEAKIDNNCLKVKTSLGLTQKIVLEPL